jgi:hypothetical protein
MSNARRLRDSAKAIRLIAEDITRVAQELAGSFGRLAAPAEQLVGPLPHKPSPALQPHAVPNPEPRPTTLPPLPPEPRPTPTHPGHSVEPSPTSLHTPPTPDPLAGKKLAARRP